MVNQVNIGARVSSALKFKLKYLIGLVVLLVSILLIGFALYQFILLRNHVSDETDSDDELIFAHTICRHGERNIIDSFPNDPWQSEVYWSGGFGELTARGKLQHYELGQYLRKRYVTLIGDGVYSANKIYIQATDKDRTIMSALASLAGLFPPDDTQKWNKKLNWQPIPVRALPVKEDYNLLYTKRCDHYNYVMNEYLNASIYNGLFKEHNSLLKYLETNSGKKLSRVLDICYLYDALEIEESKGYSLPSWAKQVMGPGSEFERLALHCQLIYTAKTDMKKLSSGFLLKEMLDRFTSKAKSTLSPDRSLWMFYGHDLTISSMMNTLGMFTLHQPPYAACLFFDLYKGNDDPYIRIYYRNSTNMNIPPLEIPNCGTKCPLNKMYQLYDDVLPKQSFDEECKLRDGEFLPPSGNPENNF